MRGLFCFVTLWTGLGLWAGEGAEPVMIKVQAHFVQATEGQMRAVFSGTSDSQKNSGVIPEAGTFTAEQMRDILVALKSSGAEVIASPQATVVSGYSAQLKSVRELRYPVEFSDPVKESGEVIPTVFESKDVGVTAEFQPVLGPSGVMELSVKLSSVEFLGFVDYSKGKPGAQDNLREFSAILKAPLKGGGVWQPVFDSWGVETSVTIYNGQTAFFGGLKTETKLLIFLTATLVPDK